MKFAIVVAVVGAAAILGPAASAVTLDRVITQGFVKCGVSEGLPGFSERDENGVWSGIDIDVCRAVAAAMFGKPDRVVYTPLKAKDRIDALVTGKIDVLSRNTTWTLTRDAIGLEFAAVTYYDGQSFMVRADLGVTSVTELDGAAICVTVGTTTEVNLDDHFRGSNMTYTPIKHDKYSDTTGAYEAGKCDVVTADQSALYAFRTKLADPEAHLILSTVISREPLGPVVCQSGCEYGGDDRWVEVIRWTHYAMLEAELRGISSKNVDDKRANSKDPGIRRLLGVEGNMGKNLNLANDWVYNIIKFVGNYAEVFERNLGPDTPLKIPRGLNALWKDGGIQYPMPIL